MFDFLKKNASESGDNPRRIRIVLLGATLGVLLLLFGGRGALSTNTSATSDEVMATEQRQITEYQEYLEKRVISTCESVAGVSRVTAIVTLSGSFEAVYATEATANGEDYVVLGSGSSASGLLLVQKAPQIVGIGIVCEGAESMAVRNELISLISAGFHVSTNRIYVTQAKK